MLVKVICGNKEFSHIGIRSHKIRQARETDDLLVITVVDLCKSKAISIGVTSLTNLVVNACDWLVHCVAGDHAWLQQDCNGLGLNDVWIVFKTDADLKRELPNQIVIVSLHDQLASIWIPGYDAIEIIKLILIEGDGSWATKRYTILSWPILLTSRVFGDGNGLDDCIRRHL